jgi:hypothetical protein
MSRKKKRDRKSPIRIKISKLRREGVPGEAVVGEAEGMADEGRLTKRGGYHRGKRKRA